MSDDPVRVVVVGATGNIGVALTRRLAASPRVGSVLGLARRVPDGPPADVPNPARIGYARLDITDDAAEPELAEVFAGADAVVHLAALFQPSHRPRTTWRTNCVGAARVFRAVAAAGVPALVHASSLVAYSPAPRDDRRVDESWPTHGWPTAAYPREKAYAERLLDAFEPRHPDVRVVRMRPAVVVTGESAPQQRRLFGGPLFPARRPPRPLRLFPDVPGLRFQVVHADDVAEAFHQAVVAPVAGAFNLAAEPVVDPVLLAELDGGRAVRVPRRALRAGVAAGWGLRLVPTSPSMLDAVLRFPLLDAGRAHRELRWAPRRSAQEAVTDFLAGLRHGAGGDTPPLRRRVPGGRLREAAAGVGERP
ncbi:NAD-dependent epimerase/dehydratase family protein [Streptomyces sp. B6B3]|uniref:NAD-dependent epimerase/dehydratase family protein n=1 Tax=Streptomyces sp. B6B3 TaxID=3153570 RepID=UPI00325DF72E